MHVILLFLILVLIYFLIINWEISLPAFIFLVYLCFTFVRDEPIKHKWRFHFLWCFFQLAIVLGIVYREEIGDFLWKVENEYSSWRDDVLMSSRMKYVEASFVEGTADVETSDKDIIIGGLKFGMSPFRVVCWLESTKELESFHIGEVRFGKLERFYDDNELYGIVFEFHNYLVKDLAGADSVVRFLGQKYGKAHIAIQNDSVFKTEWLFDYKHIVVEKVAVSYNGILSIYHPGMLKEKFRKKEEKEAKERQELENLLRDAENEKMKKIQKAKQEAEEAKRDMEERNSRLLESL